MPCNAALQTLPMQCYATLCSTMPLAAPLGTRGGHGRASGPPTPKGHWGVSWPPTHAGPSGGKCIVVVGVVVVVAAVVVAVAFVLKVRNSYTDGGRLVFKMGRWVSRRPARGHRNVSFTQHPPWEPRAGEWAADPKGH